MINTFKALALLILLTLPLTAEDVILIGSGGNKEWSDKFADWGNRLQSILLTELGRQKQQVHLLSAANGADLPAIEHLFQQLATNHSAEEDLLVYLIGHGSYLRGVASFQIPGKDLQAEHLDRLLKKVPARKTVLINGTSASAPFINLLSGEGRIICTATKSATELNATEYMAFFIQSLEEGIADQNRDQRISIWEAARQAASLTQSWYASNGLVATEHALLDDNGDGLGTRLFLEALEEREKNQREDGDIAREVFIKDFIFPDHIPRELIDEYMSLVEKARALKTRKQALGENRYYDDLEKLMLAAARLNRKIHNMSESVR